MKYRKIIMISVVLIIFAGLVMGSSWYNAASGQNMDNCLGCHTEDGHLLSWQKASHHQVACIACHKDINRFAMTTGLTAVASQFTKVKVDTNLCLDCHNPSRKVTPSGEIIVPHQLHAIKGVDCLDCHKDVGHKINQNSGGRNTAIIPMDRCLQCHNGKMATDKCQACHKHIVLPVNHREGNWNTLHGDQALQNFNCAQCHNYTVEEQIAQRGKLENFARVRDFTLRTRICFDCHRKKPLTHQGDFLGEHGAVSSTAGCYICHQKSGENDKAIPSKTRCNKCHQPNVHNLSWVKEHQLSVKEKGSAKCYECHAPSGCFKCHQK